MSESEEIEVEVVEVVDHEPTSKTGHTHSPTDQGAKRSKNTESKAPGPFGARSMFGGNFNSRSFRIPAYLWPLAIVLGLVIFALALILGLILVIPFLIIRAIVRLLVGPSR